MKMKLGPVCGAMIFKGDKLLLINRKMPPWKGFWHFPGGHVKEDELPQDAIVRELKEEAGIDIEIIGEKKKGKGILQLEEPFAMYVYPVRDHYHLNFLFLCKAKATEIKQTAPWSKEGIVDWKNPDEVKVSPMVKMALGKYRKK